MADQKKKRFSLPGDAPMPVGVDFAAPGADKSVAVAQPAKLYAKKNFVIHRHDYTRKITEGEDISDVPPEFHANLKTEGVL